MRLLFSKVTEPLHSNWFPARFLHCKMVCHAVFAYAATASGLVDLDLLVCSPCRVSFLRYTGHFKTAGVELARSRPQPNPQPNK